MYKQNGRNIVRKVKKRVSNLKNTILKDLRIVFSPVLQRRHPSANVAIKRFEARKNIAKRFRVFAGEKKTLHLHIKS